MVEDLGVKVEGGADRIKITEESILKIQVRLKN